jgi:hypothetical protein
LSVTAVNCTIGNVGGADACISPVPGGNGGNVEAPEMNGYVYAGGSPTGAFGLTGWKVISDIGIAGANNGSPTGTGNILRITGGGTTSGTWSIAPGFAFAPSATYALALKGAKDNAVYRLLATVMADTWYAWNANDLTNNGGNTAALSNIALFGTADLVASPSTVPPTPPISAVPLPAAGWLMLAGLAALAGLRQRRTT